MEIFEFPQFTIELVEDPSKTLDPAAKDQLVEQCIPVARHAFRNEGVGRNDIIKHAIKVPTAIFIKDKIGRLMAFSSSVVSEVGGRTMIYLEGTAIDSQYQGHGLYGLLVAIRILHAAETHDLHQPLICTRTQSPIVFRTMTKKLGVYPDPSRPTPPDIQRTAVEFAETVYRDYSDFRSRDGLQFDSSTLTMRRAYGKTDEDGNDVGFCMYGENIPWCDPQKDPQAEQINAFFRDHVKLQNGDAFLLIGPYDRQKAMLLLKNTVEKVDPSHSSTIVRFE